MARDMMFISCNDFEKGSVIEGMTVSFSLNLEMIWIFKY